MCHRLKIIPAGHAYDIISFDFQKAFDKTPHNLVIRAAARLGVSDKVLGWLASFLAGRTQRVRVGDSVSQVSVVTSGVIQGSSLGPDLHTVFADELLRLTIIKHPAVGFADDLKFIADVTEEPAAAVQSDIDAVTLWANAHRIPLSIEKCGALHCGSKRPHHTYVVDGKLFKSLDSFADLGVILNASGYDSHFRNVITKASRSAGLIRRCFKVKDMKLMWR